MSVLATLVLFGTPSIGFGLIGLSVVAALSMAGAHRVTAAFTILLSAVPLTAAFDVVFVGYAMQGVTVDVDAIWPALISLTVVAGLVALGIFSSHRQARTSTGRGSSAIKQPPATRRRRITGVTVALAAVLLTGTAGAAFSTSGRYWFKPSEVDWVRWWQDADTRSATDWGRTDAAVSFQLPGGGSCTLQFQFDGSGPGHGLGPARDAKDYVQATAADGTLLRDARIDDVIRDGRGDLNTAPNAWGVQVPYGYGTHSYNADTEYLEAVLAGTQFAIYRHLAAVGSAPNGISYSAQNRCIGEQQ